MSHSASLLRLDEVVFAWPGEQHPAIHIPHLNISAASHTFIHGPSGCGKSTLLSLIAGVISPQQGCLTFMGKDCASLRAAQRDQLRADNIGYVFQQFNLLPYLSVVENVALACQFSKVRKQRALSRSVTVLEEARRLLAHLQLPDKQLEQPVGQLSIGQQQRVAAARAMIGSPALIIADEPTSALDKTNREHFMNLLMAELSHCDSSLLLVSHDHELAERFEQVVDLPELNLGGQNELA
ncbi:MULTISPECIES: ABC transporter ATP-binding protein [unclassified Agarivorans]|uniref:ABC transporter ATP-binding protein n=1 Tax=unclassified Agarivorans TaxID=2636026 RepID=UPI0026E41501|nr:MULTISPECIES: ABC transporter ATP-binding protein [unclassified Agarivorans]MDO6685686.1 ABC transporter ATP-binding protein [Agarivorans sp. 3_MG-2023]MDO6716199.1 ABC transporter ATP-binding protein [Agarivorans sp. 2_MG-2023]